MYALQPRASKLLTWRMAARTMLTNATAAQHQRGTADSALHMPCPAAQVVSVAKGRVEFDFTPTADMACHATGAAYCGDNGIHIRLTETSPADPLRNLRVVMPGFEASHSRQPFHPWFLKSLARYSVSVSGMVAGMLRCCLPALCVLLPPL
jgi:hypothetical protein